MDENNENNVMDNNKRMRESKRWDGVSKGVRRQKDDGQEGTDMRTHEEKEQENKGKKGRYEKKHGRINSLVCH
jgi:hypothetical protein